MSEELTRYPDKY